MRQRNVKKTNSLLIYLVVFALFALLVGSVQDKSMAIYTSWHKVLPDLRGFRKLGLAATMSEYPLSSETGRSVNATPAPASEYRLSSEPYHSVEIWEEISERNENITFLNTIGELEAAVHGSSTPKTFLIADNDDLDSPRTIDQLRLIENHPLVRCVFAKNALYSSTRFKLIPIGPKWQYLSTTHYGEDKENTWATLTDLGIGGEPPSFDDIMTRRGILMPHLRETATRVKVTDSLIKLNRSSGWLTMGGKESNFREYMELFRNHQYVISPPGNGRDCHRHWEAFLVGTVPIILRDSALQVAMSGLPVWWVDSYDEVTESSYNEHAAQLPRAWSHADVSKLYVDWWDRHITSCR